MKIKKFIDTEKGSYAEFKIDDEKSWHILKPKDGGDVFLLDFHHEKLGSIRKQIIDDGKKDIEAVINTMELYGFELLNSAGDRNQ